MDGETIGNPEDGLAILMSVVDGKRLYTIFSEGDCIHVDEAQAAVLAYALRGIIRVCQETPGEVVN